MRCCRCCVFGCKCGVYVSIVADPGGASDALVAGPIPVSLSLWRVPRFSLCCARVCMLLPTGSLSLRPLILLYIYIFLSFTFRFCLVFNLKLSRFSSHLFPVQQTTYRIGNRVLLLGIVKARSVTVINTTHTHTHIILMPQTLVPNMYFVRVYRREDFSEH